MISAPEVSQLQELTVNLGERSYVIYISSSFDNLNKIFKPYKSLKALIISDSNVSQFYTRSCMEQLEEAGLKVFANAFPAGEESKNLDTVKSIYRVCKDIRLERCDVLVALGGGVVGDVAGFAAATYLRGIDFVQIPTSLLAQCDSSVGGKVGVDFEGAKNLVGAFYQPKAVYINVNTLRTLPKREFVSGLAEVVKHGIIGDENLFGYLEENYEGFLSQKEEILQHVIKTNCSIKSRIIEQDERENQLRAVLNLGHTVGHAIESVLGFSLLHGECVSLGMAAACNVSREMGVISGQDADRITRLLSKFGLPVNYKNLEVDNVINQMSLDKKISGGKLNFILPERIGSVIQCKEIPEDIIRRSVCMILK